MPEPRIVPLAIDNIRHATVLELPGVGAILAREEAQAIIDRLRQTEKYITNCAGSAG
jgi:hypothetical protein